MPKSVSELLFSLRKEEILLDSVIHS